MNFYEHQDRARRRTWFLGVYFVLAIVAVVLAVNAVFYFVFALGSEGRMTVAQWLDGRVWPLVSAAVLFIIIGTTLVTSLRLAGGGPALARMLAARRIVPATPDADERRLVNIVEEMSIASGTPVPALYVLDKEPGINAFVAGMRPTETILVVTRGALETFDRDELQGVIAHEYSHIFNHDMRLNIHLMGAVAGLIVIAQIGRFLMRSTSRSRGRGAGQAAAVGIALLAIGYIGHLFGALLKAAVSRQREFLADASAVQFTRNPDGIANALYRIKQNADGSLLMSARAEDISHFCFGASVRYALRGLMSTHPPLDQRIHAINPRFEPPPDRPRRPATEDVAPHPAAAPARASAFAASPPPLTGAAVAAAVGTVDAAHIDHAHRAHAAIATDFMDAIHTPAAAAEVVLALLHAGSSATSHTAVLAAITAAGLGFDGAAVARRAEAIAALPTRRRLPLLNLALPALKALEPALRDALCRTAREVVHLDQRLTPFEFAVVRILEDHLAADAARAPAVRFFKFAEVRDDLRAFLSVLAHAGSTHGQTARAAFTNAWTPFSLGAAEPLARDSCTLSALEDALGRLAALSPLLKRNVIQAGADCVIHDFTVNAAESELLQAIAVSLDCPLPPLDL